MHLFVPLAHGGLMSNNLIENITSALDSIVWGADAIAPHLGRTTKGTYHALESGRVPGARKIAGRWALNCAFIIPHSKPSNKNALATGIARASK